jgi:hypothetical protein
MLTRRQPLLPGRSVERGTVGGFEIEQRLNFAADLGVGAGVTQERRALGDRTLQRDMIRLIDFAAKLRVPYRPECLQSYRSRWRLTYCSTLIAEE